MISEADALAHILDSIAPLPREPVAVERSAGRFLAQAIPSPANLPRFDQSAMDGYAIRASGSPGTLRLVGEQPAGVARPLQVGRGEAVRIFTGAPLPAGADAVVMQEDAEAGETGIRIAEAVPAGEFVRRRGEDVCEGQQLVAAGQRITAARIGLLCAAGITHVSAHRLPRIALVTSGDELRPPGGELAAGEIYETNGPMLAAQLSPLASLVGSAHVSDDPAALAEAIRNFADADAIISSAGVSVGQYDPVHAALRRLGAQIDLWQVAIKPGKPFLFARLGDQLFFGLPGNPVSTFVTAHLFVRPALLRLAGSSHPRPLPLQLPLGAAIANPGPRVHYLRATLRDGVAVPAALQQSHGLASLAASDLLLRLEPKSHYEIGERVTAYAIE